MRHPVAAASALQCARPWDPSAWLTALEHRMRQVRSDGFVFGRNVSTPFVSDTVSKHAAKARKAAGLAPITLHECRHTFASIMIAAGVNAKALSRYMGHHSIVITLDLYGHLMPGNEDEAAGLSSPHAIADDPSF